MSQRGPTTRSPGGPEPHDPSSQPSLGATIRAWRRARDMTQQELAAAVRLGERSASVISAIERSGATTMSSQRLARFARALGVAPAALLAGELPPGAERVVGAADQTTAADPALDTVRRLLRLAAGDAGGRTRPPALDVMPPAKPILLMGTENVLNTAIALVASAVATGVTTDHDRRIMLTFQSASDIFDPSTQPYNPPYDMRHALREVLSSGWQVIHLLPRTRVAASAFSVVAYLLEVGGGHGDRYVPVYMPADYQPDVAYEYVVVPGKGILRLNAPRPDRGELYLPGQSQYLSLLSRFVQLRDQGDEMLQVYPPTSPAFTLALEDIDAHQANRCLFNDGVSQALVPMEVHRTRRAQLLVRAAAHGMPEAALRQLADDTLVIVESRETRQRRLRRQLDARECVIYDLYTRSGIERLARLGRPSRDDCFATLGADPFDDQQRINVLDNIIAHLGTYGSIHHIGLLDDRRLHWSELQTVWLVKEGYRVVLATWNANSASDSAPEHDEQFDIVIPDAEIAKAFYRYFMEALWNRLPIEKDPDVMVRWLRGQIRGIRRRAHHAAGTPSDLATVPGGVPR